VTGLLAHLAKAEATVNANGDMVTVPVADAALLPRIIRELDDRGIELAEFALRKASLDEVFLTLTGRTAQGATR
jgi:oleandomycin transport system ATP-binding protein